MLKKLSNFIFNQSVATLIVGGAIVILGKCYSLGKEIGWDIHALREARKHV